MYSKAKNHVLRLSGILWILENCFKFASSNEVQTLSFEEFKTLVESKAFGTIIDLACVKRACKINEYLVKQKLLLTGVFEDEISAEENTTPVSSRKQVSGSKSLEKTILLTAGNIFGFIHFVLGCH